MSMTERQNEIIMVSLSLIAERGIQGLTIKNIASALQITEPAIYRHFSGKYAILDAVMDLFESDSRAVFEKLKAPSRSPLEKIETFMMDRCRRMQENPSLARVMFAEELFLNDQRLASKMMRMMHSHKEQIQHLIEEGQQIGEIRSDVTPASMFRLIFGPLRLLIRQWGISGGNFDLSSEGLILWQDLRKLLRK